MNIPSETARRGSPPGPTAVSKVPRMLQVTTKNRANRNKCRFAAPEGPRGNRTFPFSRKYPNFEDGNWRPEMRSPAFPGAWVLEMEKKSCDARPQARGRTEQGHDGGTWMPYQLNEGAGARKEQYLKGVAHTVDVVRLHSRVGGGRCHPRVPGLA